MACKCSNGALLAPIVKPVSLSAMQRVISGMVHAIAVVAALATAPTCAGATPDGSGLFLRYCSACHATTEGVNKSGPSLHGIAGRPAGTVPDYDYSDALLKSALLWNRESLQEFLADPQGLIPSTKMIFPGIKHAKERAALVEYLETLR